eukprot:Ihof_evm7s46 gene=Ihof_evmTU7s46
MTTSSSHSQTKMINAPTFMHNLQSFSYSEEPLNFGSPQLKGTKLSSCSQKLNSTDVEHQYVTLLQTTRATHFRESSLQMKPLLFQFLTYLPFPHFLCQFLDSYFFIRESVWIPSLRKTLTTSPTSNITTYHQQHGLDINMAIAHYQHLWQANALPCLQPLPQLQKVTILQSPWENHGKKDGNGIVIQKKLEFAFMGAW